MVAGGGSPAAGRDVMPGKGYTGYQKNCKLIPYTVSQAYRPLQKLLLTPKKTHQSALADGTQTVSKELTDSP